MPPDPLEEFFTVFIFAEHEPFNPHPYQMIAMPCSLTCANLAPPKSVTVKIDHTNNKQRTKLLQRDEMESTGCK